MSIIVIIGLIGAILTTFAAIPQLIKILKTKKATDISLLTLIMMVVGLIFWEIYGIFDNDLPILIGNSISLIITSFVLILKLKYK